MPFYFFQINKFRCLYIEFCHGAVVIKTAVVFAPVRYLIENNLSDNSSFAFFYFRLLSCNISNEYFKSRTKTASTHVLSYSERSIFAISKPRIYYRLLILNDKTITNNKMIKINIYICYSIN